MTPGKTVSNPNTGLPTDAAEYLLEEILGRTRYTAETRMALEEAIKDVHAHLSDPRYPTANPFGMWVRERHRRQRLGARVYHTGPVDHGEEDD